MKIRNITIIKFLKWINQWEKEKKANNFNFDFE